MVWKRSQLLPLKMSVNGMLSSANGWYPGDIHANRPGHVHPDLLFYGAPKGIRIPVAALKGRSPWPLDDGGVFILVGRIGIEPMTLGLKVPCSTN